MYRFRNITVFILCTILISCVTRGPEYTPPVSGEVVSINFKTTSSEGNIGIRVFDNKESCKDYYSGEHVALLNNKIIWDGDSKDHYSQVFEADRLRAFTIYSSSQITEDLGYVTRHYAMRCAKSFMVTPKSTKEYQFVFTHDINKNKKSQTCSIEGFIKDKGTNLNKHKIENLTDVSKFCGLPARL